MHQVRGNRGTNLSEKKGKIGSTRKPAAISAHAGSRAASRSRRTSLLASRLSGRTFCWLFRRSFPLLAPPLSWYGGEPYLFWQIRANCHLLNGGPIWCIPPFVVFSTQIPISSFPATSWRSASATALCSGASLFSGFSKMARYVGVAACVSSIYSFSHGASLTHLPPLYIFSSLSSKCVTAIAPRRLPSSSPARLVCTFHFFCFCFFETDYSWSK